MIAALGAGGAMAATSAMNASAASVKTVHNAKFGTVLVAANGRTLYRYTVDSKGVNRCTSNATCAKYWPRLLITAGAKPVAGTGVKASLLGTIKAKGGMLQVTYAGYPLYTFAGDSKAGQVAGQGFDKQWYVVNTKGALVKAAVKSGGTSGAPPPPAPATTTSGSAWG
ncbi:MAG: COG4315 family predicted lipoprotein [Gaiellaceae bacterium]